MSSPTSSISPSSPPQSSFSKDHDDEPSETRIWIEKQGIFKIHKNQGDGSCLFRSICQSLGRAEESHLRLRRQIVSHLMGKKKLWSSFRKQGLERYWYSRLLEESPGPAGGGGNPKKKLKTGRKDRRVGIQSFYGERMGMERECGTSFELRAAGDLFQFHFDVLRKSKDNNKCYYVTSCRSLKCSVERGKPRKFFRYSESGRNGHWEWMEPLEYVESLPIHRQLLGVVYKLKSTRSHILIRYMLHLIENSSFESERIPGFISKLMRNDNWFWKYGDETWSLSPSEDYMGCANLYLTIAPNNNNNTSKWERLKRFATLDRFRKRKTACSN